MGNVNYIPGGLSRARIIVAREVKGLGPAAYLEVANGG